MIELNANVARRGARSSLGQLAAIALALLAAAQARSQAAVKEGLDVSANMRLRYEAIDGQARAGFDNRDSLVNLRTILTARYVHGPLTLVGEMYDSRAWSADQGTPLSTGEVNAFEPV